MAIAIAMPREVTTAAEVSVLDIDAASHHLFSELALLTWLMT